MSLEKQKRVLMFFPSCVGLSPVPHQGEERLKLPFKDYLARWILAASPPPPSSNSYSQNMEFVRAPQFLANSQFRNLQIALHT